jgi:hypothetical protein|tara:strand:+ start:425 stop:562 length:138 start_codon:yes stop_codon:yes gene_type:complete
MDAREVFGREQSKQTKGEKMNCGILFWVAVGLFFTTIIGNDWRQD